MTVCYQVKDIANTATQTAQTALLNTYAALGQTGNTPTPVIEGDLNNFNHDYGEDGVKTYWYHPDHLGSSSYITNVEGIVTQHLEYMPYGETLVEEHQNSINTPYKFNGKEQDDETGNYYYGARYYNPKFSFWLSVDPLAEKYPNMSPYIYCANNPVRYIDPDGRDWVEGANGDITWRNDVTAKNHNDVLKDGEIYRGTKYQRDKIWLNVNVRGNSESGLMTETYKSNGKMSYSNNTPWIDSAFEEFNKGVSETGSNPEITKYWQYTQMPEAAKQNNADGAYARAVLKSDKESWCAAFANWNLETNCIDGTMHALAYSFKGFGQNLDKKPVFGSIAVLNYSHVGFIVGQNPDGKIILLGGNQPGDSVNLNPTNKSTILQTRYPNGYTPTSLPLPKMNVKRGSMSYGNTR